MNEPVTPDDLRKEQRIFCRSTVLFIFLSMITLFWLSVQVARLLDLGLIDWAGWALWIVANYSEALIWLAAKALVVIEISAPYLGDWVFNVARLFRVIPQWIYELVQTYLLFLAAMRVAVYSILLRQTYNALKAPVDRNGLGSWRDMRVIQRKQARSNGRKLLLIWPAQLVSDLRGRYYENTPIPIAVLLVLVLMTLIAAFLLSESQFSFATKEESVI